MGSARSCRWTSSAPFALSIARHPQWTQVVRQSDHERGRPSTRPSIATVEFIVTMASAAVSTAQVPWPRPRLNVGRRGRQGRVIVRGLGWMRLDDEAHARHR